jgi:predicted transcriptional regulator YheO
MPAMIGLLARQEKKNKFFLANAQKRCYNKHIPQRSSGSNGLNSNLKENIMAEKTAKAPNYTTEQTQRIVAAYTEAPTAETVETLAKEMGKTVRSIVAKLSREGIYKKKEYVGKNGEKPVKKDTHAEAIGKVLALTEAEVDSLTKANKSALEKIFRALANSKPISE